jgi:hypothetical protein
MTPDVEKLIERVAAAPCGERELDARLWWVFDHGAAKRAYQNAATGKPKSMSADQFPRDPGLGHAALLSSSPRYSSSIDAALALTERLLPGSSRRVLDDPDGGGALCSIVYGAGQRVQSEAATWPLAIILATLRALRSLSLEETK